MWSPEVRVPILPPYETLSTPSSLNFIVHICLRASNPHSVFLTVSLSC